VDQVAVPCNSRVYGMPPCHTSTTSIGRQKRRGADSTVRHSAYPLYRWKETMEIDFRGITKENWTECVSLHTKEDKYIASNLYSIAEAQFYQKANSMAIYVDDIMVGYAMYGEDEEIEGLFFIDRFMIGNAFRRKGYGSRAFTRIAEMGFRSGYSKVETSTAPENLEMQEMLKGIGFKPDGEIRDEELVFFLSK